ncbi:MAG: hypothetical protein JJE09_08745 [Bacteroidia bacterium]|nr:hypothetical protein [Bacteroidia bacterium]
MLKLGVLIIGSFAVYLNGFSQGAIPEVVRSQETLRGLYNGIGGSEILYGIALPPADLVGDSYLNANWKRSSVMLYQDEKLLEGYLTRYDIGENMIQFKTKNGAKIIDGDKIKSLVWIDTLSQARSYLINAKEYKNEEDVQMSGFFEVLSDGSLPFFKKTEISIKKANYVMQFDVGNKDDVIKKTVHYYYEQAGRVFIVPSNKKKIMQLFKGKEEEIKDFVKTNSLDISQEHHLNSVFEKYNLLAKE